MRISIITVNKNNRQGLFNTINSVIRQSYPDIEFIVIDGSSTDGSTDVISSYASGITHWISEDDNGVYQAMNKGIEKATGQYCLFLNSGDCFINNESLSLLCKGIKDEDIIFGNIEQDGIKVVFPDDLTLYSLRWGSLPHPATLIKRVLINRLGNYNEQNRIASDWEFWLKAIIIHNCSYRHVNEVIASVEKAGLSSVTDITEGSKILLSLFPPRILADYDRFRVLGENENNQLAAWLIRRKFLFRIIKFLYTRRGNRNK